jgi:hypothetical protein
LRRILDWWGFRIKINIIKEKNSRSRAYFENEVKN